MFDGWGMFGGWAGRCVSWFWHIILILS
jgi:hypothetical protein